MTSSSTAGTESAGLAGQGYRGLRRAAQGLALVASHGYLKVLASGQAYQGPLKSVCLPVLNCHSCPTATTACPVGTLQHFAALHRPPLFLFGLFGLVGLAVGRMACGWICPFGLLQDLLHRVRSAKIALPRWLCAARWPVLLILVLAVPFFSGVHGFSVLCPLGTLSAAIPWSLWNPLDAATREPLVAGITALAVLKVALLGLFLWLFVVAKRPFCRIVCPVGLCLSLFNRCSMLRLHVDEGCTRCGRCAALCPMELRVCDEPNSGHCIRCLACTACPHVTVTTAAALRAAARRRPCAARAAAAAPARATPGMIR